MVPKPLTRGGGFNIKSRKITGKAKDTQKIVTLNKKNNKKNFNMDKASDLNILFKKKRKKRTARTAKLIINKINSDISDS